VLPEPPGGLSFHGLAVKCCLLSRYSWTPYARQNSTAAVATMLAAVAPVVSWSASRGHPVGIVGSSGASDRAVAEADLSPRFSSAKQEPAGSTAYGLPRQMKPPSSRTEARRRPPDDCSRTGPKPIEAPSPRRLAVTRTGPTRMVLRKGMPMGRSLRRFHPPVLPFSCKRSPLALTIHRMSATAWSSPGAPLSLLDERNRTAEAILASYTRNHAKVDAATGTAGGLLPFGGPVVAVGQLFGQTKVLYPALARDLAAVYASPADRFRDVFKDATQDERLLRQAAKQLATSIDEVAQLGLALGMQFQSDFLQDIALDLAAENAPGLLGSAIPIVGAFIGGTLDALVAVVMTWRVGTMIAVHLQHGDFVVDRQYTWKLVKRGLVKRNMDMARPGLLTKVRTSVPQVQARLVALARDEVRRLEATGLSRSDAVRQLGQERTWQVPADVLGAL